MERTVSATEAHIKFDELMLAISEQGETVIVEQDGLPCVVLLPFDVYERMKEFHKIIWENWQAQLTKLHSEIRASLGDNVLPSSVDIIEVMRAERDEQLTERYRRISD